MKKPNLIFLFIATLLFSACSTNQQTGQKDNEFKNGAVVTAHPLASEVGLDVLKNGGNAVDAAVAVKYALAIVYPNAENLGGGSFMNKRNQEGQIRHLNFRKTNSVQAHL